MTGNPKQMQPVDRVSAGAPQTVLIVDDEQHFRDHVAWLLGSERVHIVTAASGRRALDACALFAPDAIITDIDMPDMDGLEMLRQLRMDDRLGAVPVIMMSERRHTADLVQAFEVGADDYVRKPFDDAELVARVQAKLARKPVPVELLDRHAVAEALTLPAFTDALARELSRATRAGTPCVVAEIRLLEADELEYRFGGRGLAEVTSQLARLVADGSRASDFVGTDGRVRLFVTLPDTDAVGAQAALALRSRRIIEHGFHAAGQTLRLTPILGFTEAGPDGGAHELMLRASAAADRSALHLDLRPAQFDDTQDQATESAHASGLRWLLRRWKDPLQAIGTVIAGTAVPFLGYVLLARIGFDIAPTMYLLVVIALAATALSIWVEGWMAHRAEDPPPARGALPTATAIIAAYLPNEAMTVEETIEAFRQLDYPNLQIILAYNSPKRMPIEDRLAQLAAADPRFVPFRVEHSTSKSQNVNAALAVATGEIIGVFDADSKPQQGNFQRAWAWLSNGADVVQGHNAVRNGDASLAAQMVAVEFELIYSVSHPGRALLHGFGIFGGSNGYWRASLLHRIRMHGDMLTEDIDSSMRVISEGGNIVSDPKIVCWELAPTSFRVLWHQRMRWAQGWFQVSLKHGLRLAFNKDFSLRQRLGAFYLLGWREVYPWVSVQAIPLIAYFAYRAGGLLRLDYLIPIFVLTTLFTASVGPAQAINAYLLSAPEIKRHRNWFVTFIVLSVLFYTEMMNTIGRVAHVKEFMKERAWKVTPRSA